MTVTLGLIQLGLLLLATLLVGGAVVAGTRMLLGRDRLLVARTEWHDLLTSRDAALREAFDERRRARELESALIALSGEMARNDRAAAARAAARRGRAIEDTSLTIV